MSGKASARIRITGRVQMVGFRWFTKQWADDLDLSGWVRNNRDGSVELEVEGRENSLQTFIGYLKEGPRSALVDRVDVDWLPFKKKFRGFRITY